MASTSSRLSARIVLATPHLAAQAVAHSLPVRDPRGTGLLRPPREVLRSRPAGDLRRSGVLRSRTTGTGRATAAPAYPRLASRSRTAEVVSRTGQILNQTTGVLAPVIP